MKKAFFILLPLIALSSTPVLAQVAKSQSEEDKKILGVLIDRCATVTGGNYLNQKCQELPDDVSIQLSKEPVYCQETLGKLFGLPNEFFNAIDQAAKETAENKPCGEKSRSISIASFNLSVQLHQVLENGLNRAAQQNIGTIEPVVKN